MKLVQALGEAHHIELPIGGCIGERLAHMKHAGRLDALGAIGPELEMRTAVEGQRAHKLLNHLRREVGGECLPDCRLVAVVKLGDAIGSTSLQPGPVGSFSVGVEVEDRTGHAAGRGEFARLHQATLDS